MEKPEAGTLTPNLTPLPRQRSGDDSWGKTTGLFLTLKPPYSDYDKQIPRYKYLIHCTFGYWEFSCSLDMIGILVNALGFWKKSS